MSYPLSLSFLTTFDVSPCEAVEIAARTGYQAVGLRLSSGIGPDADLPLLTDAHTLRDTQAALKDTGIMVADIELVRLGSAGVTDGFLSIIERGAELGARHLLVVGTDPEFSRLKDNFARLCEHCSEAGLTADLELMPWTTAANIEACSKLVDDECPANGGILLDALHLDRAGDPPEAIANVDPARINYIQFCDGPMPYERAEDELIRVARTARLNPGETSDYCTRMLDFVPAGTLISVEVPNFERARTLSPELRAQQAMAATRRILEAHRNTKEEAAGL